MKHWFTCNHKKSSRRLTTDQSLRLTPVHIKKAWPGFLGKIPAFRLNNKSELMSELKTRECVSQVLQRDMSGTTSSTGQLLKTVGASAARLRLAGLAFYLCFFQITLLKFYDLQQSYAPRRWEAVLVLQEYCLGRHSSLLGLRCLPSGAVPV